MRRIAESLANQMTAAGITPDNIKNNSAYVSTCGNGYMRYSMAGDTVVLGGLGCALQEDGDVWICWGDFKGDRLFIAYRDGRWVVI